MKNEILHALCTFAQKRPKLELNNYATLSGYLEESRAITKDLHHARKLLRKVELSSITAQDIVNASNEAFSGRLTIIPANSYSDEFKIEYCIGQYFATEYRKAVCAVLARALWNHWRSDATDAQRIRNTARSELGATLARAYFN
jgi:hypothetical protein